MSFGDSREGTGTFDLDILQIQNPRVDATSCSFLRDSLVSPF